MPEDILSLTKFCDIDSGLKILNSQSLRWSAPHLLRDPFELHYRSTADFTPETLLKAVIKEAISMLFGAREPSGKSNRIVAAIARWREEERFASEEEADAVLNQLLGQMLSQQQPQIDQYLSEWQQFARAVRICCFCDKPSNQTAWRVYADNHQGIALKFSAGEDSALADPRRVSYSQQPPEITTKAEQVGVLYGKNTPPTRESFIDKLLSKNRECSQEREWRCFELAKGDQSEDDQLWYNDKTFKANELKALYLGLGISASDRDTVLDLMHKHFRNTRIFQAVTQAGSYDVDFVQVNGR